MSLLIIRMSELIISATGNLVKFIHQIAFTCDLITIIRYFPTSDHATISYW